jgi:hypothetical protein
MCEERGRLVNEYVAAAHAFTKAALKLRLMTGEAFIDALAESEAAHLACDKAREALHRHKGFAPETIELVSACIIEVLPKFGFPAPTVPDIVGCSFSLISKAKEIVEEQEKQ